MARIPQKVDEEEVIKRSIPMMGWVYNAMIDEAKREKRDVNAQIALVVERAAIELLKQSDKSPGNSVLLGIEATQKAYSVCA